MNYFLITAAMPFLSADCYFQAGGRQKPACQAIVFQG